MNWMSRRSIWGAATGLITCCMLAPAVWAQNPEDYPPLDKVTTGFEEIKMQSEESSETQPFYRLWIDRKNNQVLAELPKDFAADTHRQFIATTLSGGDVFAGLQSDDYYVYWRQYGKRLALIAENLAIRGSDDESKSSVKRLFTDQVLMDLPIVTWVPRGGPVVDLDEMCVNNSSVFFGSIRTGKPYLSRVLRAKPFPENIEIAFEVTTADGSLKTLHYSISRVKGTPAYKPREADERIGYFTTNYDDYGKYDRDTTRVRYVNRWHLEKRDPSLKLSPPKQPIVFYLEHTTPVRYRRWVREGVLYWNQAFEKIGIVNAIEVRQQDKQSNTYMNIDPEDVRYNFIRWLNNNISTAIGPSRVNPTTGEILDADIVLTDGWIRAFEQQFTKVMPKVAMEGMSPETLAWLAQHPEWDPRVRLAAPDEREFVRQAVQRQFLSMSQQSSHTLSTGDLELLGNPALNGLAARYNQANWSCFAADGRQFDVAVMRMTLGLWGQQDKPEGDKPSESDEQLLDGMPESFIGPLLADLVCHEVGHTLGLRHNFKASSLYTMAQINSNQLKGKKPMAGSVMDYLPVNFNVADGEVQGDYTMIGVGPYDLWAIEYGYTLDDKKLPEILKRVAEPELVYGTDEDALGSDPLARRYDFSKNPIDYAKSQIRLAQQNRQKILESYVKEGDSWSKAREGYQLTLSLQTRATSMMANWLGGSFINRDKKGDPNGRKPIEVVPAALQRDAMQFVIDTVFQDSSYGLTPELQAHLVGDVWRDGPGGFMSGDLTWPIHDQIMGVQASALTQLMNPTVLRRVHDNESRVSLETDVLTLPELMGAVTKSIWTEIAAKPEGKFTDRQPAISSLRRNLQFEHLNRLFDLAELRGTTAALKPIANLATLTLQDLKTQLAAAKEFGNLDTYSRAHVLDLHDRIAKFLEGKYARNTGGAAGGGIFIMREPDTGEAPVTGNGNHKESTAPAPAATPVTPTTTLPSNGETVGSGS